MQCFLKDAKSHRGFSSFCCSRFLFSSWEKLRQSSSKIYSPVYNLILRESPEWLDSAHPRNAPREFTTMESGWNFWYSFQYAFLKFHLKVLLYTWILSTSHSLLRGHVCFRQKYWIYYKVNNKYKVFYSKQQIS